MRRLAPPGVLRPRMVARQRSAAVVLMAIAIVVARGADLPCAAAFPQEPAGNPVSTTQPTTLPAAVPLTPDRLYALASPAVVTLTVKDEDDRTIGTGSAFVVRFQEAPAPWGDVGYYECTLVTSYQVIRPAVSVTFAFGDGSGGIVSQVVAEDPSADVAVLSVLAKAAPQCALPIRKDTGPPVGTRVYVIGGPKGLSNALSEGLIGGYRPHTRDEAWIQVTAPISPESSGSPLLSETGDVLGVVTAAVERGQNSNFAAAASTITRLLADATHSRAIWKGASIRETERWAFTEANIELWRQFRAARGENMGGDDSDAAFVRFRKQGADAGDQLALVLSAEDVRRNGGRDEALVAYKKAAAAKPSDFAYLAHYAAGREALHAAQVEDAMKELTTAKELNPHFGPTRLYLAQAHLYLQQYPEMLVEAEFLVWLMPRCYEGYTNRASAWAYFGRDTAFERDMKVAFALRPNDANVYFAQGHGYETLNKLPEAAEAYRAVIALDESRFGVYLNIASVYQGLGEYDRAIAAFQKVLEFGIIKEDYVRQRIAECQRRLQRKP